jgi:hypothetical protein
MDILNCPKCKGMMELGFVIDHGHGGVRTVSQWAEGEPQKSFWTGLKVSEPKEVSTHRCTACGYLESYAK